MRSKRLAVAVAVAATLAVVPLAAASLMHPKLAARLSGMGERGVVNLQSHTQQHELCWNFDLHVMHPLGSTIRDAHGMVVAHLGHMYRAQGCAMVPKQSLAVIETKPGGYWVWVATKNHPGELRGRLFAGMAQM